MIRRTLRTVSVFSVASAALFGADVASAACVSTPTTASQADPIGDGDSGVAPDVTALGVTVDGTCTATFSYALAGQTALATRDFLGWWINADGNVSTGSPTAFVGADYSLGRNGTGATALARWDAATAKFAIVEAVPLSGSYGVQLDLTKITGAGTRVMTVAGGTSWTSSTGAGYYDFVSTPLPFTVTTGEPAVATPIITPAPTAVPVPVVAAAPAPVVTAAPTVTPVPSADESGADDECEVPPVRRMTLTDARAEIRFAGCKVGKITKRTSKVIKAGRVIQGDKYPGETVPVGTKINLVISTGKPKKSAKRSSTAPGSSEVVDVINELADAQR